MSRENLFRAKKIDSGEWIEGYLFRCWQKAYILWGMINDVPDMKEIDPETIGEHTGLTDKDGKKFEGDIFQASDGEYMQRYIIAWDEYSLEWSAQCIGDPDGTLPLSEFRAGEIDVIGNIFDNPELLE